MVAASHVLKVSNPLVFVVYSQIKIILFLKNHPHTHAINVLVVLWRFFIG